MTRFRPARSARVSGDWTHGRASKYSASSARGASPRPTGGHPQPERLTLSGLPRAARAPVLSTTQLARPSARSRSGSLGCASCLGHKADASLRGRWRGLRRAAVHTARLALGFAQTAAPSRDTPYRCSDSAGLLRHLVFVPHRHEERSAWGCGGPSSLEAKRREACGRPRVLVARLRL